MQRCLLSVIQACLGSERLEIDTFTQITSMAGADDQPFHNDVGPLWPVATQGRSMQVDPHGVVAIVPLLNVSESRGPTHFQAGSHFLPEGPEGSAFWKARDADPPAGDIAPTADVGDVILFDLRLRHRGGKNRSGDPRPLLYISYVLEWWQDRMNFASAQSLEFDKLPTEMMKLHSRLDHREHVRRVTQLAHDAGLDIRESAYKFQQHTLTL